MQLGLRRLYFVQRAGRCCDVVEDSEGYSAFQALPVLLVVRQLPDRTAFLNAMQSMRGDQTQFGQQTDDAVVVSPAMIF
jgi:hypothetical protein